MAGKHDENGLHAWRIYQSVCGNSKKMANTEPKTYRVSLEVDEELKRLARVHGGVDKALRILLEMGQNLATKPELERIAAQVKPRVFKGPLLKPSEKRS